MKSISNWTRAAMTVVTCAMIPASAIAQAAPPADNELREAGSVTFRSVGEIKALMFSIERDRSIILTPMLQGGKLMSVKTRIVDHADDDKVIDGMMKVSPEGQVYSDEPEIVNACNILNITPAILRTLKQSPEPVVTQGATEVSGKVHPTRSQHTRLTEPNANGIVEIRSHTKDADGIIDLETMTVMGPDGLPIESKSHGTIKKGLLTLTADLKTVRIRNEVAVSE